MNKEIQKIIDEMKANVTAGNIESINASMELLVNAMATASTNEEVEAIESAFNDGKAYVDMQSRKNSFMENAEAHKAKAETAEADAVAEAEANLNAPNVVGESEKANADIHGNYRKNLFNRWALNRGSLDSFNSTDRDDFLAYQNAIDGGSSASGEALLPVRQGAEINIGPSYNGVYELATVISVNGLEQQTIPVWKGKPSGSYRSSTSTGGNKKSATNAVSNESVKLSPEMLGTDPIRVPAGVFQNNSAYNVAGSLEFRVNQGLRSAAQENFLNGSGAAPNPQGILSTGVDGAGIVGTREIVTADANAVTADELNQLSVLSDEFHGEGRAYLMNEKSLAYIRTLALSQNASVPLYTNPATGVVTINGFNVEIDSSMDDIGAGNRSIIFGNFEFYVILESDLATRVRIYQATEADYTNNVHNFIGFRYNNGIVTQADAFNVLKGKTA